MRANFNQDLEHFWFIFEKALTNGYDYFKMGKEVLDYNIDHQTGVLTIIYKDHSKATIRVKNLEDKLLDEDFLTALYGKTKGKTKVKEFKKQFNPFKQMLKDNPMPINV